jgi:DNA-binding NtrC family response regulator
MANEKILVVDDEKIIRTLLKKTLEDEGYNVDLAVSGTEGLDKIKERKFDLVLLDIRLIDENGVEILRKIKGLRPDMIAIMMTAYASIETAKDSMKEGAFSYIQKPLDPDVVILVVKEALGKRAADREVLESLEKCNILVIDDDEIICKLLKKTLTDEGYRVETAGDGYEALKKIKEGSFDIMLVDLIMEGMAGLEGLRAVREIDPEIMAIIITAHPSIETVVNSIREGAYDYIIKPIDPDEVLASVRRGWEKQRLKIQNKQLLNRLQLANNELRESYNTLKKTRDQLIEAEKLRALGQMASGVAHEFNNLLAVVLGNIQLLKMELSGHEGKEESELIHQTMEMLDTIEKAASDGTEVVRRVQEYARIRKDKFHTPVNLNDMVENSVKFLKPRWKDEADKKKITINLKTYLSDIPPILGNESELRQVMINLMINSIDAMPEGGDITIRTGRDGEDVKVTIEDTGIGISKENSAKVFDPFFSTKDFKGTGLGLSVAYGIVKRHDGKIALESVPGKGTTFILTFPAGHEKEEKEEASPGPALKKAKILVIDDDELVRNVLSRMMSAMGHEVEVALSGREGLTLFHRAMESSPFGLVFTDLGMPKMNGWEVAGEVKKLSPATPVALITGWGLEVDRDEMKRQGVDLIITKPVNMKELAGLIQEAMLTKI